MKTIREVEQQTCLLIGRRLHEERTLQGLSLTKLGKAIGVSFQALQKYEKGKTNMTPGKLRMLGKLLNVPVGYFFDESDSDRDTGDLQRRTPKVVRALRRIEERDPEIFVVLAKMVSSLAKIK